jgi:outer membrane protein assembly factor BamB
MNRLCCLATVALACCPVSVFADDWPQWLGPQRDGVWREKGLVDKFPAGGPKVLWRTPAGQIGEGYAGPAVADGKVYIFDRLRTKGADFPKGGFDTGKFPGVERIVCLDQASGKIHWFHAYDCTYEVSYAAGPRTTPVVSGGKVYTLGTMGDLVCLNVTDGKVIWSKNLPALYNVPTPRWGFSGHPLLDGNRLICLVAGQGSTVVAFDKDTGKELWKNLSSIEPGYAPPMIYTFNGKRQLILWHAESVNGLEPETGKVIWTQPFGTLKAGDGKVQVQAGMTINTPRQIGDRLYLTCFYEGSLMLRIGADNKPAVLWKRKNPVKDPEPKVTEQLHCVMSTPVIRDGYIYGVCSYGELRCLELETGKRLWETHQPVVGESTRWGNAFLTQLGESSDRYLIFNELGDLILARLTPQKYEEISRAHILEPTNGLTSFQNKSRPVVWSHPAFANRCVFARNDGQVVCISLAAE